MFTGIIECLGVVTQLQRTGTNLDLTIKSSITGELKIDQSLAHNGVCLTVVAINGDEYTVTAIDETLGRTNIGALQVGDVVNLERAMVAGARLDGHMVQGHVDTMATVEKVVDEDGSWKFYFTVPFQKDVLLVEKGSVTIDGVSLTVVDAAQDSFSVAIIPYTYEHTRFHSYQPGRKVNIEFDIIGKYLAKQFEAYKVKLS